MVMGSSKTRIQDEVDNVEVSNPSAVQGKPALQAEPTKPTLAQQIESLLPNQEPGDLVKTGPTKAEPAHNAGTNEPSEPEVTFTATEVPSAPISEPADPRSADSTDEFATPFDIWEMVETVVGDVTSGAAENKSVGQGRPLGSSSINQMFDDVVGRSSDTTLTQVLKVPARDIMVTDVVWCDPDDAVRDVIAKMQQCNTGYVLVGRFSVLEGLVSNSNILGAVSPYLRPLFAKWHRREDDATLEIKIKWIMSRPVRTVTPDASLASIIESMRRFGGRCLPVVGRESKVQGLVTVFDILLHILEADKSFSWEGRPPQAPPLLI
jgi:CBS domain-containing protein